MEDEALVLRYAPCLLADRLDPFPVRRVGCTVFRQSGRSASFARRIEVDPTQTAFVIEYALAYTYDIQHLYELEHVWVYVGHDGAVRGCEGSWHGKVINELLPGTDILQNAPHVRLYSQPGKHALVPSEACLHLYPWLREACGALAGADGFAYPWQLYGERIELTEAQQDRVRRYIREHYAFAPSMEFAPVELGHERFCSWDTLRAEVPQWLREELHKILTEEG